MNSPASKVLKSILPYSLIAYCDSISGKAKNKCKMFLSQLACHNSPGLGHSRKEGRLTDGTRRQT
jgi:hypothetical protein